MKSFDRCLWCYRPNQDRPFVVVLSQAAYPEAFRHRPCEPYVVSGPRGPEKHLCRPYTHYEREAFKARWTAIKTTPAYPLDRGIAHYVQLCRDQNLGTVFCCDGHGLKNGYIAFYDKADAEAARLLLKETHPVGVQPKPHHLLGKLFLLWIPATSIHNPEQPRRRGTRLA